MWSQVIVAQQRLSVMALDRSCTDFIRGTIVVQQWELLDLIVAQQWIQRSDCCENATDRQKWTGP
jgi:hypothetical protein